MSLHRTLRALAVLTAGFAIPASGAQAAVYASGYGAVPFYTFEEEALNDRMGIRVNVASGNLLLTASDLGIAGTGLDLALERSYNSLANSITELTNGNVEFQAPSYFKAVFVKQADGTYKAPMGFQAVLGKDADGVWTVRYNQSRTKLRLGAAGNTLSSIVDKNGNVVDPKSDAAGLTYAIDDTQGRRTTLAYDVWDRVTSITDPSARQMQYRYNADSDLSSFTDGAGNVTRYAYDTGGRLAEITDPRGNKTKINYDSSGRTTSIVRVTDAAAGTGPTTRFAYATGDSRCPSGTTSTAVTDPNGNVTTYCTDDERRVKKVIDALGHTRDSAYDADANVTQLTDGSAVSKATWLEGGRIETVSAPTAGKSSFSYGDAGHKYFPTSLTNPQGRTTSFS